MKKVMPRMCAALMAVVLMIGCAGKNDVKALGGEWDVVSIGQLVVPDSVDAFLGFDIDEQLIYGCAGCNRLTGALLATVDATTPLFAALGSTRMLCADMTVEDALLPALARVVGFTVDSTALHLLDADGTAVVILEKR